MLRLAAGGAKFGRGHRGGRQPDAAGGADRRRGQAGRGPRNMGEALETSSFFFVVSRVRPERVASDCTCLLRIEFMPGVGERPAHAPCARRVDHTTKGEQRRLAVACAIAGREGHLSSVSCLFFLRFD